VVIGSSGSDLQAPELARALADDREARATADIAFFAERVLTGLNPLWLLVNLPNMPSAHVAIQLGARGPNSTVMTDWVAGSQAIGEAFEWIRAGEADAVLAGGADSAIQPFALWSYEQAGILGRDARRGGERFVPGEGAAILLLEERDHARRRGAEVRGEMLAYAAASAPLGSADNALGRTIAEAMAEAGWQPGDIGVVATASVFDDRYLDHEERALQAALGPAAATIPRARLRSRVGHALAAAGPIDLALLLAARPAPGGGLLCSALGYSGQAVSLAVEPAGIRLERRARCGAAGPAAIGGQEA
jgi:3-oxoacyl-[acyl-carrier-protein] synthase II